MNNKKTINTMCWLIIVAFFLLVISLVALWVEYYIRVTTTPYPTGVYYCEVLKMEIDFDKMRSDPEYKTCVTIYQEYGEPLILKGLMMHHNNIVIYNDGLIFDGSAYRLKGDLLITRDFISRKKYTFKKIS